MGTIYTFIFINLTWIFFRVNSVGDAVGIINKIIFSFQCSELTNGALWNLGWGRLQIVGLIGCCCIVIIVDGIKEYCGNTYFKMLSLNTYVKRFILYFLILYIMIVFVQSYGQNASAFIYSQF